MDDRRERLDQALEGRYRLERELGVGGMATVYLAHDPRHERKVAIKFLHPELAAAIGAARFLSEIRLTAGLQHPNVLAMIDSGNADGLPYYVMPFIAGESLRERLDREHQLPIEEAMRLTAQVAEALDYAHGHGIVHRDIKPANLLLQEGHLLVADFGIAIAAAATDDSARLTQAGLALGTPAYMSPEQVLADPTLDGRSDLYALACVLYEMLAGHPVFQAPTSQAVMSLHVVGAPTTVTAHRPDVPRSIASTIARALSKDPNDRYATGAAFVAALRSGGTDRADDSRSIVVLPFTNMSADAEHDYFCDGLTEEVISTLSKVRALRVISRTSAMQFKGRTGHIREVTRALGVRYALEGGVRRAGGRLRITAQLIDSEQDAHLWSDKYDGTIDDIFDMQDRVAGSIVQALSLTLTVDEAQRLTDRRIPNAEAFDHYLKAREEIISFTTAGLHAAQGHLEQALALVGEHPTVLRGLATACWQTVNAGLTDDFTQLDRVLEYAERIRRVEPNSPYVAELQGLVYMRRGSMMAARQELGKAYRLDRNDPEILFWYAVVLVFTGQFALAKSILAQSRRIDPGNSVVGSLEATALYFQGDFDEAARRLEALVRERPLPILRFLYGASLAYCGRSADAIQVLAELASMPQDMFTDLGNFLRHALRGDAVAARAVLTPETERRAWADFGYAGWIAQGFAVLGETSDAMRWLERAI